MDEVTIHDATPEVTTRVRLSTGGKIIVASFAGIFVGLAIAIGLTKIGQEYEPRGQHVATEPVGASSVVVEED
jgi:hypothetical protein